MPSTPSTTRHLPPTRESVSQAADLLRSGKLVILPTETVYGIALNLLSDEARQRVKTLKNLTANAAWVLHLAQPEDLSRYLGDLSPLARRMVAKAWPGPVAFQFRLTRNAAAALRTLLGPAADETLLPDNQPGTQPVSPRPATEHWSTLLATFRCPDAPITREIIAAAQVPLAIIGAALPGQPPAYDPASVPAPLADHVEAVLDGGPTRYRKPSTLVRIDGDRIQVIRPGVIDARIIERMADRLILFICSGNTCRSPMAAGLAAQLIAEQLGTTPENLPARRILVQSAGLHAARGLRATWEAVEATRAHGIDLSAHLSQPATVDLLRRADLVYTMTDAHREEVLALLPGAGKKTVRLDPDGDIDDPIGADEVVYRQVAEHLRDLLRRRLREMVP